MDSSKYKSLIKSEATRLGFIGCGVAKAQFLADEAPRLESWLSSGMHGQMGYMDNYFDLRLDPSKLVPGAKSVVSLLYNYFTEEKQPADAPKISKYARGRDYHKVVKAKLKKLMQFIHSTIGEVQGRAFVDSAPVLERAWALRSGLGWVGKNAQVISPKQGSFFFLAELIIDLELPPDLPFATDHCGTCTACMDACPTQAIVKPNVVDGSRCISYLTIELEEAMPQQFKGKMDGWAFGCDVCQDVCPWNRFSKPHTTPDFYRPELLHMTKADWTELTEEVFDKVFDGSPLKRPGYENILRNLRFLGE